TSAEDRPALLLPAVEDDPRPHGRRWRREFLRPGRPPHYRPAPAPGGTLLVDFFRFSVNQLRRTASIQCRNEEAEENHSPASTRGTMTSTQTSLGQQTRQHACRTLQGVLRLCGHPPRR